MEQNIVSPNGETLELTRDANRILMEFGRAIRQSSGHIYTSVLPFSPPCRLKQKYTQALHSRYIILGSPAGWDPCYCTVDLPSMVLSIAYSNDGSLIAAGTKGGNVYIINSMTGAEVVASQESEADVISVVFAPDGGRLVSTAGTRAVIWYVPTGARLVTLEGHTKNIRNVAFASDGIKVITGSEDNTLGVWDSHSGHLISRRSSEWKQSIRAWRAIGCVSLSPDTSTISRAIGNGVEVWDWHEDYPLRTLAGPGEDVQFLPNNRHLIAESNWKNVDIWDYQAGTLLKTIAINDQIYISPFGNQMAHRDRFTGEVTIWDTETWSVVGVLIKARVFAFGFDFHGHAPLAFSPTSCTLAYSPFVTHIRIWECTTARLDLGGSVDPLSGVGIVPDILAVSDDGVHVVWGLWISVGGEFPFKVWDFTRSASPRIGYWNRPFKSFTWSPDGRLFVSIDNPSGELWWPKIPVE